MVSQCNKYKMFIIIDWFLRNTVIKQTSNNHALLKLKDKLYNVFVIIY